MTDILDDGLGSPSILLEDSDGRKFGGGAARCQGVGKKSVTTNATRPPISFRCLFYIPGLKPRLRLGVVAGRALAV